MFIRVKNMANQQELNVNIENLVSFEPANNGGNSKLFLIDGRTIIVEESNRALRHACKKASGFAEIKET